MSSSFSSSQNNRKISKIVIPIAGMGTRFLPATKALPKELLPIIDRPIIHYIVEEAVNAGIETVVFVTSRPKVSIEDYFDPADLSTLKLKAAGKEDKIESVLELSKKIDIVSVRQYVPQGLGHAILQADPVVSGQCFAVSLGDDVLKTKPGTPTAIGQCIELFQQQSRGSVVGVVEVPKEETKKYGIISPEGSLTTQSRHVKVKGFVEKPDPSAAPSNWAMPGRYVFEPEIMDAIRNTKPGKNNELQLTDAMDLMRNNGTPYFAALINGERYDTGDKVGYILANAAFALENKEHGKETAAGLRELLSRY